MLGRKSKEAGIRFAGGRGRDLKSGEERGIKQIAFESRLEGGEKVTHGRNRAPGKSTGVLEVLKDQAGHCGWASTNEEERHRA